MHRGPDASNRFIREVFLPEPNARFATPPEEAGSAFVAAPAELWRDELCAQEERRLVGNDNGVRFNGRSLQIPPSPFRPHFVRATVRIHADPDGSLALFKGPRRLTDFPPAEAKIDPDLTA